MELRESTLGVDFGTTFTTVFYWDRGKVERMQIDGDELLIRSAISYKSDEDYSCGKRAMLTAGRAPLHVRSVKRVLGRKYFEIKEFENDIYGCKLQDNANDSCVFVNPDSELPIYKTPVEVTSDILKHIKVTSEEKVRREFNNIVLSYPSTFQVGQKAALREAARNAGFTIKGMITEPTAAGVHYKINNCIKNKDVVLVFDFGGGTLDLSLMVYEKDSFYIFASGGHSKLGGNDIDLKLYEYVEKTYRELNNAELFDVEEKSYYRKRNRLLTEIEEKKIILQNPDVQCVDINTNDFDETTIPLTDRIFEDIISDILNSVMDSLNKLSMQLIKNNRGKMIGRHRVTSNPNILKMVVDSVILVGGSSKLKAVQNKLRSYFSPEIVHIHADVQECVGSGVFHSFMSIMDPSQRVREVLYHALIIHIGETTYRIETGTTSPFQVTYAYNIDPYGSTLDLHIEEEVVINTEPQIYNIYRNQINYRELLPRLESNVIGIALSFGLDCILHVSLHDYFHGDIVAINAFDVYNVCFGKQTNPF